MSALCQEQTTAPDKSPYGKASARRLRLFLPRLTHHRALCNQFFGRGRGPGLGPGSPGGGVLGPVGCVDPGTPTPRIMPFGFPLGFLVVMGLGFEGKAPILPHMGLRLRE